MGAEVLNGTVTVGDRVAYATRSGSSMHMRIGKVIEIMPYESERYNRETRKREPFTAHSLRVEVELSSGRVPEMPTRLTELDRVAKLDAPAPVYHPELSCTQASTERAWSPTVVQRARVFGFG